MGNLNEIQKQTTQSYGDNSFTTTIKENTVEFDSAKDSFTFNDEVNVPSLKVNGQEITPAEPQVQADWNQTTSTGSDYIKNKPAIKAGQGEKSIIEGNIDNNIASDFSHAEGWGTTASGIDSHTEGQLTTASGDYSHAEGYNTTASGDKSHAEGERTTASGDYSHTEGTNTTTSASASHAEGNRATASGYGSHAEGQDTKAIGPFSHAEGLNATASVCASHAEGNGTTANGAQAHAEGANTTASGDNSHAEGQATTASGTASHAEGTNTTTSGPFSHAEGSETTANHMCQHVFGEYNELDPSAASSGARGTYIEIVGKGNAWAQVRSNARTLDWSGNEQIAGTLRIGSTSTGGVLLKCESNTLKISFDNGTTWLTVSAS